MTNTIPVIHDEAIKENIIHHEAASVIEHAMQDDHTEIIKTLPVSALQTADGKFVFKGALSTKYMLSRNVSLFTGNQEKGLSKIQGTMTLADASTGQPVVLFQGNRHFTGHRTGAAGAFARHIMQTCAEKVLVFGSGDEAIYQFDYHYALIEGVRTAIKQLLVYSPNPNNARQYMQKQQSKYPHVQCRILQEEDIETACKDSPLIITATSARNPLFNSDWVSPGAHITAVGADMSGKREIPIDLVEDPSTLVVVDSIEDARSRGVLQGTTNNLSLEAWQVLEGHPRGNPSRTLWAFSGRGSWDLYMAEYLYGKFTKLSGNK